MIKILIADDHAAVRQSLREALLEEFSSVYIEEAEDTGGLLKKANEDNWHLIISDLYMPGGGGLKALRLIKSAGQETPIIIMSMFPAEQYAQHMLNAGAYEFINKDLLPGPLIDAIHRILENTPA